MIPRSALNIILLVIAAGLARYFVWFHFDTKVEDLELWSILSVGVIFGFLYQIVSDSTKTWFVSVGRKLLYSPLTTKTSLVAAILLCFSLLIVSHIDIYWGGIKNIELFVDSEKNDGSIRKKGENKYSTRIYGISFVNKFIVANVFEKEASPIPFVKQSINIPAYAIMKENENIQEVEKQLLMAFFQFFEARYLDEAKKQIGALKSADAEQEEMLSRLDSIRQLIELSIIGPDVSNSASTLMERYEAIYTDDPWIPLLKAAYLYGRKEYLDGFNALATFEERSKYPNISASLFFQGVLILRIAREADKADKDKKLDDAVAKFKSAETELATEPDGVYKNLALSSARYFQGIAEFYRRNLVAARDHFENTAEIAQGDILARAWNGVGYISFILGELQDAELALLDALEASSTFAYARSNYGYVLLAQNKLDQAIILFQQNEGDEKLNKESYRDVVLAKLAIALANELKSQNTEETVGRYAAILNELKLRDFVGIDPPELRLAYMHNEIGEKIYLDKHYYGLEIFALSYFARSALRASDLVRKHPDDKRVNRIAEKSKRNFNDLRAIVDTSWVSSGDDSAKLFSPITAFAKTQPNK